MEHFFVAVGIILAGGILPLFLYRQFSWMKAVSVFCISAGCLTGLADAVVQLSAPKPLSASISYLNTFSLSFFIDPLAAFFLAVIFFVSFFAAVYSFHYMDQPEKSLRTAVNFFFFSLLIAAMAAVVCAGNMVTFMLAWEIMSLSSCFLVIYNYQKPENRRAGYMYFVFSHVGAMFIFSAFGLMYGFSGSFGFEGAAALPETVKTIVFVLAFIGFGSKAGVFPAHVWLPHAHPAAPSHISAVMSGVMIKTGIYGILRMYALLGTHTLIFGEMVLIAGMVSGILGVVYALGQQDLKRMLAYSSIENMGIILIGLGLGMIGVSSGQPLMAVLGFAGGLLHVLNHSIFKSLLFMAAGMVIRKTGTGAIDALGGLLKNMKITGVTFLAGSLAISGLPPLNGFISELLIYLGGFKGVGLDKFPFILSMMAIISLAVIGGLALACFSKALGVVFQGEPRSQSAVGPDEKGPSMILPMMALAGACLLIGAFPKVFILMAVKAVGSLALGYGRIPIDPFIELAGNITRAAMIFTALLCLVLALRMIFYRGKTVTRAATWGCGFTRPTVKMQYTGTSYAASILGFFRFVAPLAESHPPVQGRFPEQTEYRSRINDVAERQMGNIIVRPVLWLFDRLRWIQQGDIHPYIGYILVAIVVLLFFV